MLSNIDRGNVETIRNRVQLRFETKQLVVFDPKDPGTDFDVIDPVDPTHDDDEHYEANLEVMKMIIAVKHLIELPITLLLVLFFNCKLPCRFFSFNICKVYVFAVYFILLVQDFVLMTPPIWIFAYHVALLMTIFIVSLKHRDRQSRRRRAS